VSELRRIAVLVLVCAAVAVVPASPAMAYNLLNCRAGANTVIKWQRSTTAGTYTTVANSSIAAWESASSQFSFSRVSSGAELVLRDVNKGQNGWLGATLFADDSVPSCTHPGNITPWSQTIYSNVNRSYLDAFSANNKKQAIWVHEIGHALGLVHSDTTGCGGARIMYIFPQSQYDDCGTYTPRTDDINGANFIY